MTPEMKTVITAVDAVISASRMPNSVVAYKGMTADFAKAVETLQPGDLIVDQGYTVATLSPLSSHHLMQTKADAAGRHTGEATVYKILVPHGSLALPLNDGETELLIARGSGFRYMGTDQDGYLVSSWNRRRSPRSCRSSRRPCRRGIAATFVSPNVSNIDFSNAEHEIGRGTSPSASASPSQRNRIADRGKSSAHRPLSMT